MDAARHVALIGRVEERQELRNVIASVRDGMSGTLILRGEAGIGKTALLDDAATAAHDLDVLRVVGTEAEMNLKFAALHQLLHPLLDDLPSLPPPQADALRAAFGISDRAAAADRMFVGLATLTLLAAAVMTRGGIVLLVDDAQWLDTESESILAFVARRLYADRIGLFVAVRDPTDRVLAVDGLPTLELGGLEPAESTELLASMFDGPVDEDIHNRVLADARGNPLALLELTRELLQAPPRAALLPQPLPVDGRLKARFLRQVRELPAPTQRLLLAAAADQTGDGALLWRVGNALDFDEDAAKDAEAADLITFGPPITFRHPLIREAIYHGANGSDRRRTHAALAKATDATHDPDRRVWHLASATLAPDEDVAAELEAVAARAHLQGGHASAAVLLARASELTPDASRRGVRMLQAAAADFTGGQVPRAQAALEQALPMLHDPFVSAQARRLEGAIQYRLGMNAHSPSTLLQAAIELYAFDVRLARETALEALQMAVLFGAFATHRTRDVARAAKHMPLPPGLAPTSSDLLLEGLAEYFSSGPVTAAPALRRAVDAVVADPAARELPRRLSFGIYAAFALGDNDALRTLGAEYVALARRDALDDLPEALHYLGTLELRNGTLLRADSHFTEEGNFQMMSVYGRVYGPQDVGRLMVLAWRGVEAPARAWASMLASMADERQHGWTAARVDAALATLELGLGNYAAATGGASDGWQDDIAINCIVAADVIEAHVRSGTPERTGEYISCLEERAAATNMQLELGLLARSRALLSDGEDAEPLYREAITCLTQNGGLFHVARAQLLYGEWLRRKRRRTDAREQLRAAHQTFNALSVAAFAERARIELRATGETARKRTHDTRDDLTPQETQVATIAASGATNSEIAAQMFISANTVDYHLRKVYRKLGITSRRALATAMRTGEALP